MLFTIICYAAIYIIWSTTAFAIKVGVTDMDPFYFLGLRFMTGGLILLVIAWLLGRINKKNLPAAAVKGSLVVGTLLLIGNGLVTVAVQKVDSYLAALVISCIPILVLIYDRIILGKPIRPTAIAGVGLGVSGVAFLLFSPQRGSASIHPYIFFVVVAIMLWSLGITLGKRLEMVEDTLLNSGLQQFSVGLFCLISVQVVTPVYTINWSSVSTESWIALLYLVVFGTFAITCFLYLLKHEPNERIVTYNFVNPLGSTLVGIWIGGEAVVAGLPVGAVLILTGLFIMFYGHRIPYKRNG